MRKISDSVPELIQSLCRPGVLDPQSTREVELVETHISYVLVTDRFAYKIKKAVNLGFVDFSTLEKRAFYCSEEVRLNRRFAESLYIGRVRITGSEQLPVIDGEGDILDYAVKMKKFDQSQELNRLIHHQVISNDIFWKFSADLALIHENAEVANINSEFATFDGLRQRAETNFSEVKAAIHTPDLLRRIEILSQWTDQSLQSLSPVFDKRRREGRIRECHGDLHLRNLVLIDHKIVPFDCLEFNEHFRWIDVASELAFLLMDLTANGFKQYARIILNGYLESSGDYELLQVLRHYLVYRSMVRAKVTCLRDAQKHVSSDVDSEFIKYLNIAEQSEKQPFVGQIIIVHGLSGSGKSWLSKRLIEAVDLILIRSDIVRKKMQKEQESQDGEVGTKQNLYSAAAREQVYRRLLALTGEIVRSGYPVIVDATFLKIEQRRLFKDLSEDCGVGFKILNVHASKEVLESRIVARQRSGTDASEADTAVLYKQMATAEPLQSDEQNFAVKVDSEMNWSREAVLSLAKKLDLN